MNNLVTNFKKKADFFKFSSVREVLMIVNPYRFIAGFYILPEAAVQRSSYKKLFWKYAANLQEDTHAKVHSGMGVPL